MKFKRKQFYMCLFVEGKGFMFIYFNLRCFFSRNQKKTGQFKNTQFLKNDTWYYSKQTILGLVVGLIIPLLIVQYSKYTLGILEKQEPAFAGEYLSSTKYLEPFSSFKLKTLGCGKFS